MKMDRRSLRWLLVADWVKATIQKMGLRKYPDLGERGLDVSQWATVKNHPY